MSEKKKYKSDGQLAVTFRQFRRDKLAMVGLVVLVLIVLACLLGPIISPYDYTEMDILNKFAPISRAHPCGTDEYGRDLLTRILKGGQISLLIGLLSVLLAAVVSAFLGAMAAFFGGAFEVVVTRLVDILMSIPGLLLAAAISTALGTGVYKSVIAIAVAQMANMTRIMYSSALTLKGQEYLEAARINGASQFRIVLRYIIPNCLATLIVQVSLRLGMCITRIASLSFIGLGVTAPTPEWGTILNAGKTYIRQYWPMVTFPGIAIALTLISVNLVGDGIRDALDPRLKR